MAGTSIIFPDLALAQADVMATTWTPEIIAPQLVSEFVLGGSAAASVVNNASGKVGTVIGAPAFGARSMAVGSPASAGIDTGIVANEPAQTFVIVARGGAGGGVFVSSGSFLGIMAGVSGGPWSFYNSQSGVAPAVASTAFVGAGYQFVIGWGAQGDVGQIRTAQNGALNATTAGTAAGGNRTNETVKIGGGVYQGLGFDIAFAARVPAFLTEAQMLNWYRALRGDGTAAGSVLGVAVL